MNMERLFMLAVFAAAASACGSALGPLDGQEGVEQVEGATDQDLERPEGECLGPELCNGIDDDCDGLVDEDFDLSADPDNCGACGMSCALSHAAAECREGICRIGLCEAGFHDVDGDPYNGCEYACAREAERELDEDGTCGDGRDNDCDGRTDAVDPDCSACVPELCNGLDDDCDSLVDEDFDLRGDPVHCGGCETVCPYRPYASPLCVLGECGIECQRGRADLNGDPGDGCEAVCVPAADPAENVCDGVDNDCDGPVDEDYAPYTCGRGACEAPSQCVDAVQVCIPYEPQSPRDVLCDGRDNDCDGMVDEDFAPILCRGPCAAGARCEAGVEICGPRLEDYDATCDGVDGDCDGETDEDYVSWHCGIGVCESSSICAGGAESCTPLPPRSAGDASCNGEDDDCDGATDEDYVSYACGTGACVGLSRCEGGAESCEPTNPPPAEFDLVCDGIDEDCDGAADEDYEPVRCGTGLCASSSTCSGGVETPCVEGNDDAYEASGGDSCAGAVPLGTVTDNPPGVMDIVGTIYPPGDHDWYRVTAGDDADTAEDEFNFEVLWVTRPPGIVFDLARGSCSGSLCSTVEDCASWYTDFSAGGLGESPCRATVTGGFNLCTDDSGDFYIHVYRSSGTQICAAYTLRVRNNPAFPGVACAHP